MSSVYKLAIHKEGKQPVGLLLLSFQLAVSLLQFVREEFQVSSQLVIRFELL